MNHSRRLIVSSLAATLGLMLGCATPPSARFFTLAARIPTNPSASLADRPALSLAVGPVDLPEYLDRPQIVTRLGENQLEVHELDRWGGLLQDEATSVIARNLAALLNTRRVHVYPSRAVTEYDYRVAVDVLMLEGHLGGLVVLDSAWSIIDDARAVTLHTAYDRYEVTAAGQGFDAYAAAISELLARLSRDIAGYIATRLNGSR